MPFDMGFDFRGTAGLVTDPAYGVPVLAESYPHTYTNANGDSINAGWDATVGLTDRTAPGYDVRLAGINYPSNDGTVRRFKVDLSSGSAPGAGTYTVDHAIGDQLPQTQDFKLLDTNTVLTDGTNGGSGLANGANQWYDATLALVSATTTWTGTTASKTFATTLAQLAFGYDNIGGTSQATHFRLTLVPAVSISTPFSTGRPIFKVARSRWG